MAERSGQRGRRKSRFRDQQAARGFLVEPMHQPRFLPLCVAHHFQHLIDMPRGAGTALHRQTGRLVQHHDVGVLIQDHVLEGLQRLRRRFRELANHLGRIELERRNADALAFFKAILAVGTLAVDAQLAFADDALDVRERQAGKTRLEKTVDAHVVLVRGHHHGLNFGRQRRRLGDGLLGLGHERLWLGGARRGRGKPRGRLATGSDLPLRPLRLRSAIGTRALRAVTGRTFRQWSSDATAHGVLPLRTGTPKIQPCDLIVWFGN